MKRGVLIGAAVLVALAAAPALWLALDNGGDRRAAALVEPAGTVELGTLTLNTATGTVTVPVQSFSLGITTPYDAATAVASGKARPEPLQLFRPVDSSSPSLFKILVTNEAISSAEFVVRAYNPATEKVGTAMTYTFGGATLSRWDDLPKQRGLLALSYQTVSVKFGFNFFVGPGPVGKMTISSLGEASIPIADFATGVAVPMDATTGLASGKRQHKAVLIRHPLSEQSGMLLEKQITGTGLGTVTVELTRASEAGPTEIYAKYVFGDVVIVSIEDAGVATANTYGKPTQDLKLVYKSIQVTVAKITGQDSLGGKP